MTPDALLNRARAIMGSMPLASSDDEECDADDYENFVEKLTAEFLAIRNEAIEEAARECDKRFMALQPTDDELEHERGLEANLLTTRIRALVKP